MEAVWLAEKKAEEEQVKLDQLRKEIEEERAMQELKALHEATGRTKKKSDRLEWMYASGPSGGATVSIEEKEAFLLGKKRLDNLVEPANTKPVYIQSSLPSQVSVYGSSANTWNDTQTKIREDPLLAIKKREQATLQSVLANPLQLKRIKKEKEKKRSEKHSKEKSSRKSRSRERHDSREKSRSKERRDSRERRNSREKSRSKERHYSREKNRSRERHQSRESRNYSNHDEKRFKQDNVHKNSMDKEQKLREMLENAKKLEKERASRHAKHEQQEREAEQLESERRAQRMETGDSFMKEMNRSLLGRDTVSAAEMISRNRAYKQRD